MHDIIHAHCSYHHFTFNTPLCILLGHVQILIGVLPEVVFDLHDVVPNDDLMHSQRSFLFQMPNVVEIVFD